MSNLQTILGSEFIARLPPVSPAQLRNSQNDECPCCNTAFGPATRDVVRLSCRHQFCRPCLSQWLSEGSSDKNTCPTCRRELFIKPPNRNAGNVDPDDFTYAGDHLDAADDDNTGFDDDDDWHGPPAGPSSSRATYPQPEPHGLNFATLRQFTPREILQIWFAASDHPPQEYALYDFLHLSGVPYLPARRDPSATRLTRNEELDMFAELRRRPGTFVLRRDEDKRDTRWFVYVDGWEREFEFKNASREWREDQNNFMMAGIRGELGREVTGLRTLLWKWVDMIERSEGA